MSDASDRMREARYYLDMPPALKPPNWRFRAAVILGGIPEGDPRENEIWDDKVRDRWLSESLQFVRSDYGRDRKCSRVSNKDMRMALEVYNHQGHRAWRWILEALLMTPETDKRIAELLGGVLPASVIGAYRKVFFDIDPYRGSAPAVSAQVFSVSYHNRDIGESHDYLWKMFAYRWGAVPVLDLMGPEGLRSAEQLEWVLRFTQSRMTEAAAMASLDPVGFFRDVGPAAQVLMTHARDQLLDLDSEKDMDPQADEYFRRMHLVVEQSIISDTRARMEYVEGPDGAVRRAIPHVMQMRSLLAAPEETE